MKKTVLLLFVLMLSVSLVACKKNKNDDPTPDGGTKWNIKSPNEEINLEAILEKGHLYFQVKKNDVSVLDKSELGLSTVYKEGSSNVYNDFNNLEFVEKKEETKKFEYETLSGKTKKVNVEYSQITLTFSEENFYIDMIFRAYNDGYTFRYNVRFKDGKTGTFTINDENTHFALPSNAKTYGMEFTANVGIKEKSEHFSYEEKYQYVSYNKIGNQLITMPFLYFVNENSDNEIYSLITESDIYGKTYHGSFLQKNGNNGLKTVHAPASGEEASLESELPFTSPWRVAVVGDINTIIESTLVEDVYDDIEYWKPDNYDTLSAEEKKIYDYEWVKPGAAVWSYLNFDGDDAKFRSQRNWELQRTYVDAAAKMGWTWIVLDAGWNDGGFNESDFTSFVQYANSKGLKVMVWADAFSSFYTELSTSAKLSQWQKWGIEGVKIDFFDGQGLPFLSEKWKGESQQSLDRHYEMIYQQTAKYQMVLNCHGGNKPTGERRQYPHVINREAIRGYEFQSVDSKQTVLLPFTRGTVGPSDFTPAIIPYFANTVTVAHNMALSITIESGMPTYSDIPSHYSEDKVWFNFFKDLPVVWDETKLVKADLGNYVIIARRSGSKWYIGCTAVNQAVITFNLDFLGASQYQASVWTDSSGNEVNHYLQTISKGDEVSISVPKNGGFTMIIDVK